MIITASKKLPEEYENVIRDLLLKSFGITIIPPFDYCFTALQDDKILGFCAAAKRNYCWQDLSCKPFIDNFIID
ncbi:MAG: hypothetical protein KA785_05690 [Spirochaetaceae bacterium]|jgi:hypothetical protein|nr:hypothetical protein [Spirochaetaceae bacterium]